MQAFLTPKSLSRWLSFGLLLASSIAYAQSPPDTPSQPADAECILTFTTEILVIKIQVTNNRGEEVLSLTKDDFVVYENGVRQDIDMFKRFDDDESADQKARYTIGYSPINNARDGKLRNVRVVMKSLLKRHLKLKYTPTSYTAPEEKSEPK